MAKKFRYYIINLFDGNIEGSDDEVAMMEASYCDEYFIVDTNTGEWLSCGKLREIKEIPSAAGATDDN